MRRLYEMRLGDMASLDQKITALIGWACLVLALASTLQLILTGPGQPSSYWIGLGLVFALYAWMIVSGLTAFAPRE